LLAPTRLILNSFSCAVVVSAQFAVLAELHNDTSAFSGNVVSTCSFSGLSSSYSLSNQLPLGMFLALAVMLILLMSPLILLFKCHQSNILFCKSQLDMSRVIDGLL